MRALKKVTKEIFIVSMISIISVPHNVFAEAPDNGKKYFVFVNYKRSDYSDDCNRIYGCDVISSDSQDASPLFDFGGSVEEGRQMPISDASLAEIRGIGDAGLDVRCSANGGQIATSRDSLEVRMAAAQEVVGKFLQRQTQVDFFSRLLLNALNRAGMNGLDGTAMVVVTYADGGIEVWAYSPASLTITSSVMLAPASGVVEQTSRCNRIG